MAIAQVFKVALTGYDATTDTDPNHFSLYVDQSVDYILIKEKAVGSISVPSGLSPVNIAHSLGYIPHCIVFAETSSGVWRKLFSFPVNASGFWYEISSSNLILRNTSGTTRTFAYHIFYDNIT